MAAYDLELFQRLVTEGKWGYLNFRRADQTKDNLDWDDDDVAAMLCGLTGDDFQKTVPNCKAQELPGDGLIDADQYEICWDDTLRARHPKFVFGTRATYLSLKIAIIEESDGQFAGLVTLHLS